jgi:hypothetical protein
MDYTQLKGFNYQPSWEVRDTRFGETSMTNEWGTKWRSGRLTSRDSSLAVVLPNLRGVNA